MWGELSEKKLCLGRVGRAWEDTWGERPGAGWAGLDLLLECGQLGGPREDSGRETLSGRGRAHLSIAQMEKPRLGGEGPAEAQVGLQGLLGVRGPLLDSTFQGVLEEGLTTRFTDGTAEAQC